jgi:hypothetical protein
MPSDDSGGCHAAHAARDGRPDKGLRNSALKRAIHSVARYACRSSPIVTFERCYLSRRDSSAL